AKARCPQRFKCARQDSNLRPFAPEANALSPELRARGVISVLANLIRLCRTRFGCGVVLRPVELSARTAVVTLAETFTISRGSEDEATVVQVEVSHDGQTGYGEAAPLAHYDESGDSALAWLEGVTVGDDPFALDAIFESLPPGEYAARAALDHALYDLQ